MVQTLAARHTALAGIQPTGALDLTACEWRNPRSDVRIAIVAGAAVAPSCLSPASTMSMMIASEFRDAVVNIVARRIVVDGGRDVLTLEDSGGAMVDQANEVDLLLGG